MNNLAKINTFKPALTGLAAKRVAASEKSGIVEINPTELEHRIGIVFDDSGSMYGTKIRDARAGVEEFLRSCEKDKTAVCIYPMNAAPIRLNNNLPALAILASKIEATGGTPLLLSLYKMLSDNNLTRAIVFSDGQPNDFDIKLDKLKGIPVDTVYIGHTDEYAERFMKELAEKTGGIYLKFDPSKSNFRTAFKYLSPGLRYMLTDKSFVSKLQGE